MDILDNEDDEPASKKLKLTLNKLQCKVIYQEISSLLILLFLAMP